MVNMQGEHNVTSACVRTPSGTIIDSLLCGSLEMPSFGIALLFMFWPSYGPAFFHDIQLQFFLAPSALLGSVEQRPHTMASPVGPALCLLSQAQHR